VVRLDSRKVRECRDGAGYRGKYPCLCSSQVRRG